MVNIPLLTTTMSLNVRFDPWTPRMDINSFAIKPPHLTWKIIECIVLAHTWFETLHKHQFQYFILIDIFPNGKKLSLFLKYFQWHTFCPKCTLIWINYFWILLNWITFWWFVGKKNSRTWFINEKHFRINI